MYWDEEGFEIPPLSVNDDVGDWLDAPPLTEQTVPTSTVWEKDNSALEFLEAYYTKAEFKRLECMGGEIMPPDVDKLAQNLKSDITKPSNLLAKEWVCPQCKRHYKGSRNLICDIQHFRCIDCGVENPTSYSWSLDRCRLNGVAIDFSKIYHQYGTDHCILYSFLALCDMSRRIRGAKYGLDESSSFDEEKMLSLHKRVAGYDVGNPPTSLMLLGKADAGRCPDTEAMLRVAVFHGVPYRSASLYDRHKKQLPRNPGEGVPALPRTLKVTGWFKIDVGDTDLVTRLIANGVPLLASLRTGARFSCLPGGDIYYAPAPHLQSDCRLHCVVLHGSGIATPQGDEIRVGSPGQPAPREVCYRCRDSYGTELHLCHEGDDGEGADFNVWSTDLTGYAYGIVLPECDRMDCLSARVLNSGF